MNTTIEFYNTRFLKYRLVILSSFIAYNNGQYFNADDSFILWKCLVVHGGLVIHMQMFET